MTWMKDITCRCCALRILTRLVGVQSYLVELLSVFPAVVTVFVIAFPAPLSSTATVLTSTLSQFVTLTGVILILISSVVKGCFLEFTYP